MSLDKAIIQQYYAGILRLTPSAATINSYAQLPSYEAAMSAMMTAAVSAVNPITKLYQAAFDRVPDSAGLTNYTAAYGAGAGTMTLKQIANQWTTTIEFTTDYPASMPNADYVGLLYWNVLHREADPVGAANFTAALNSGKMTRADVLLEMSQSPEFGLRTEDAIRAFQEQCALNDSAAYTGSLWDKGLAENFNLTTGPDELVGNAADNTFTARVVQNVNGEQTNQLATGDQIDGGGGIDTLNAKVIEASALNHYPGMAITPETVDVEVVNFTALATHSAGSYANSQHGGDTVEINAKYMNGVEVIGSVDSDASLLVTNVNTLRDDGLYENKRLTSDMTVRMDHSGNDDVIAESDMTVLFDNDYLLREGDVNQQAVTVAIEPLIGVAKYNPLLPLNNNPYDQLSFLLDGVRKTISLTTGTPPGPVQTTYAALHDAIVAGLARAALTDPSLADVTVVENVDALSFYAKDGVLRQGDSFTLAKAGATLSSAGPGSWVASAGLPADNAFGAVVEDGSPIVTSAQIEVNVELEKVGRGSDGGDLTIGGMATDFANTLGFSSSPTSAQGIEKFNVLVSGDASQFSSLASLQSTNNTLQTVVVTSAVGSEADLIIGNHNTVAGSDASVSGGYVAPAINWALKDVRDFDSTAFANDLTLNAVITGESVAKYMDLTDTDAHAADNAVFNYNFGIGDDTLNLNISKANLAFVGTTTREDFELNIDSGAGDDHVTVQIGDGQATQVSGVSSDPWLVNSVINDNLNIDTGEGSDTVFANGAGAWNIALGANDDTVYSNNFGASPNATWVFNTADQTTALAGARTYNDLTSDVNSASALIDGTVTVTFKGLDSQAITIASTAAGTTDLQINQAIKAAINGDAVLGKLLIAEDGPANTLIVTSLIDGAMLSDASDLAVSFKAAIKTDAQWGALGTTQALQNTAATNLNSDASYDSAFANSVSGDMIGANSLESSANTLQGQAGDDVVVMSTGGYIAYTADGAAETAHETALFETTRALNGHDTVVNFTAGSTGDVIAFNFGVDGNLDQGDLNGAGTAYQTGTTNAVLGANTGFFMVTTDVADATEADTMAESFVGSEAGDIIYMLTSTADDVSTLYQVNYTASQVAILEVLGTFTGVEANTLSVDNLANFV